MPWLASALDLREHADLVAEVEARGRLIHHQHFGLLSERPGDERELPLTAAHFRICPVDKIIDPEESKQFSPRFPHLATRAC